MKNITTRTKIIVLLISIIIIIGIAITFTIGLNFELRYQATNKIQVLIGEEFEISDIKQITNEIFPGQEVLIQRAREFKDVANITTKNITEEQKNNLVNKINEKYGQEAKPEDIVIVEIPHTRGRDIIKPYIFPFSIATVIIAVYMSIRYRKLGYIRTLMVSVLGIIIAQVTLLSVIAITRIPIGRLTISLVLIVYVLTLMGMTNYFENKIKDIKEE